MRAHALEELVISFISHKGLRCFCLVVVICCLLWNRQDSVRNGWRLIQHTPAGKISVRTKRGKLGFKRFRLAVFTIDQDISACMTPVRGRLTINKDKKCFPWHIDMNPREVDLCGPGKSRI